MKRRHRLLLVAVVALSFAGGIIALTRVSAGSEGPLSSALSRIGAGVASLEHRARASLHGGDRAARLAAYEPYRMDAARLRAPNTILLGAYDDGIPGTLSGIDRLEQRLGTSLPVIQLYSAFGDKPDQQFPRVLIGAIADAGSIPLVTWEPWLTAFENSLHPNIPLRAERDKHGMAALAAGTYDDYVDTWARDAKNFARPLMVRFAHEMNDPYRYPWGPQHNTRDEYIAGWRHVVERFRAAGATNVVWVWSPHVAYEGWEAYYPGDAWVDWVATGVLNFGPIAQWSRWWTFDEIFAKKYPRLASFRKPVMIAELGSLAVGGDRAKWYRDALIDLPRRFPAVHAVLFFNVRGDQTVTYQKVDWTITDDSLTAETIRSAIRSWDRAPTTRAVDSSARR